MYKFDDNLLKILGPLNRKLNKSNTVLVIYTCIVYHLIENRTAVFTIHFDIKILYYSGLQFIPVHPANIGVRLNI